jgi:hypothetical protein
MHALLERREGHGVVFQPGWEGGQEAGTTPKPTGRQPSLRPQPSMPPAELSAFFFIFRFCDSFFLISF